MTEISSDVLSGLGLNSYRPKDSSSEGGSNSLDQSDFLELMITQLKSQDPMDPQDSEAFVAQLAQFSTLSGITELNDSFANLAQTMAEGQALQAASLVGREVLLSADTMGIDAGESVSGGVSLSSAARDVTVNVYSESGKLVRTLELGDLASGLQDFSWDGLLEDGSPASAGNYVFVATGRINGVTQGLDTCLRGQVQSVSMENSSDGLVLDVNGFGSVGFSEVVSVG